MKYIVKMFPFITLITVLVLCVSGPSIVVSGGQQFGTKDSGGFTLKNIQDAPKEICAS
jgi:hypothetical protein